MRTRDRFITAGVVATGLVAALTTWQVVHSDEDPASQFVLVDVSSAEPPVETEIVPTTETELAVSETAEVELPSEALPAEVTDAPVEPVVDAPAETVIEQSLETEQTARTE